MRPLRVLLLVLFGLGSAAFIALVIPGVLFMVRHCSDGGGVHNSACRQGVILAAVAAGMLLLALASALALVWVKELPADPQAKAGLQGKGAQVTPLDLRSYAVGGAATRPTQDEESAMRMQPPYHLYYNPMAPAFQDYPGAASRLEWHLAASQQLLWSLLHPGPPPHPQPPPHPLDPHPVPGQPYFDWDTMGSVLPGIQGGRYLQQSQHHSMGAANLMDQSGAAGRGLPGSGAPLQPPASAWEFQAPRRGTAAYLARLEDMQGPHWRPVSSAGKQSTSLSARQVNEVHLEVQGGSVTAGEVPRQVELPQDPAQLAPGAGAEVQAPAAPLAPAAGPQAAATAASAAEGAQGQDVAQLSVKADANDQPVAAARQA